MQVKPGFGSYEPPSVGTYAVALIPVGVKVVPAAAGHDATAPHQVQKPSYHPTWRLPSASTEAAPCCPGYGEQLMLLFLNG